MTARNRRRPRTARQAAAASGRCTPFDRGRKPPHWHFSGTRPTLGGTITPISSSTAPSTCPQRPTPAPALRPPSCRFGAHTYAHTRASGSRARARKHAHARVHERTPRRHPARADGARATPRRAPFPGSCTGWCGPPPHPHPGITPIPRRGPAGTAHASCRGVVPHRRPPQRPAGEPPRRPSSSGARAPCARPSRLLRPPFDAASALACQHLAPPSALACQHLAPPFSNPIPAALDPHTSELTEPTPAQLELPHR
jgi:hypothetical protein